MRLLIDTHILLWALFSPARIPAPVRIRLEDPDNQVLFSAASIWELSIKLQIGRLDLPLDLAELVDAAEGMGFEELPIASRHTMGVQRLPLHHRDPFDRILIAQAVYEPARFLTMDKLLARYSELVEVVG